MKLRSKILLKASSALINCANVANDKHAVATGLLCAAGGCAYLYARSIENEAERAKVRSLLDSGYEGLAVEQIEEGEISNCPAIHVNDSEEVEQEHTSSPDSQPDVTIKPEMVIGDVPIPIEGGFPVVEQVVSKKTPQFIEVSGTPIRTDLHRKVKKTGQMQYMNAVIAECKVKFGVPTNTRANQMAVARYAGNLMKQHGLRPTHIRQYKPLITKMVFVADKWEVEAEKLAGCRTVWKRVMQYLALNAASVVPLSAGA